MRITFFLMFIFRLLVPASVHCQPFIHPGIDQNSKDLAYMKQQVLKGEQPWKSAFDRLKASTDTVFNIKAFTHVLRGPYGKPNIGGDDLSKGANMAYNYALIWYITQNKTYADKAMAILNAWSPVLWDFDYNDAKLLAAWTGHVLCNAAELLRYSNSGWQQKDIDQFSNMMTTVYYPLIRFYYPQANGNWDGAIIHSIMAIAIFTDNSTMFNNAVNHFLYGTVNGGIFKYLYPSGQCQESSRDQGHVQLGIGEFAGAAQVAFTQGVDLLSIGDNRIALGFEYTAGFLLGGKPQCYGIISERAKNLRDDYEYVYNHYSSKGVELPFVKKAADSMRLKASRTVLTSVRIPSAIPITNVTGLKVSDIGYVAGAGAAVLDGFPANAIIIMPGQAVQQALDAAAGSGRWVVLKTGIHTIPATLKMPSSVTLAGEGLGTILFLDPASGARDAIVNADNEMHDITIRDLVIEGAVKTSTGDDPNNSRSYRNAGNRGGIIFRALHEGDLKHISFSNLTVQNCTFDGVLISGGTDINITRSDFNENGSSVIPGPKLQHNLLLTHCASITIKDCRLDTSPFGSGLSLDHCTGAMVTKNEIARNALYGIGISESNNVTVSGNLIEANDRSGVMMEFLQYGTKNIVINNNFIRYNGAYGVESYSSKDSRVEGNNFAGNAKDQQKISNERTMVND